MTNTLDNLRKRANAAMENVSDSARDTAAAAKERLNSAYGTVRHQSEDIAEKAKETAKSAISQGRVQANNAYAKGKIKGTEALHKAGNQVQDYPLATLAGAIVAGLLIGLAVPKRGRGPKRSGSDEGADA